jgi:uncharacterized protein with HEPN domain
MEKDLQALLDMLNSAKLILTYILERTKEDLLSDQLLQDGVIRRLIIIGEASVRVSTTTQQNLPDVPWRVIKGMRNRLVHEYDDLNLAIIWDTIIASIPNLVNELEKVIPSEI